MLYVSDFKAGKVLKFPLDGKSGYSVFTELKNPTGIRLGPDGNIYVKQKPKYVYTWLIKHSQ